MKRFFLIFILLFILSGLPALAQETITLRIETSTLDDRAAIANSGAAIEYVHPVDGWVVADVPSNRLERLNDLGYAYEPLDSKDGMPSGYEDYHDFEELVAELESLHQAYPALTDLYSIGQTNEGREIWCLKISDNPEEDATDEGAFVLVAFHHAREILTGEVALYTAQQILESYDTDEMIRTFVDSREIYIIPNLNPDGTEYDRSGTRFRLWRKNRSDNNGSSCKGVDLNRNYGYEWGGPGATAWPCDLTYHGPEAFSEPETSAFRDFIYDHENVKMLVTLHTYSELILYPWGYVRTGVEDLEDRQIFKTLAGYMAEQNQYTPQQASELYPTSGDTTDWAYGELGIFAYTFELSPSSPLAGNFYPKPSIFERAFPDNYNALLLAYGLSNVPERVLSTELWKMKAELSNQTVTLQWASIVETNASGWNVLRSNSEDGNYVKINSNPIEAGQDQYEFSHSGINPGDHFFYKIEYLSTTGRNQTFGPMEIAAEPEDEADDDDLTDDDASDDASDDDSVESDDDDNDDDNGCCG